MFLACLIGYCFTSLDLFLQLIDHVYHNVLLFQILFFNFVIKMIKMN